MYCIRTLPSISTYVDIYRHISAYEDILGSIIYIYICGYSGNSIYIYICGYIIHIFICGYIMAVSYTSAYADIADIAYISTYADILYITYADIYLHM